MTRPGWLFCLGIIVAGMLVISTCGGDDDRDSEDTIGVATATAESSEPDADRRARRRTDGDT